MPKFRKEDYDLAYESIDEAVHHILDEHLFPKTCNWQFWVELSHETTRVPPKVDWPGYLDAAIPCPFTDERLKRVWRKGYAYRKLGHNAWWRTVSAMKPELRYAWVHGYVVGDMSIDDEVSFMEASPEGNGLKEVVETLRWMVKQGMAVRVYEPESGKVFYRSPMLPVVWRPMR